MLIMMLFMMMMLVMLHALHLLRQFPNLLALALQLLSESFHLLFPLVTEASLLLLLHVDGFDWLNCVVIPVM